MSRNIKGYVIEAKTIIKGALGLFGTDTNNTEFESDGTIKFNGNATVYDDLTGDITRTKTVGVRVTFNDAEGTIEITSSATTSDYLILSYQMSHKWKLGSVIYPHIHFEQNQNSIPYFLIQYRWQQNGQEKKTAWTNYKCNTPVYTYSGTIKNNIATSSVGITPPVNYSLSDIIQLRVIRDTTNSSGLFTGEPTYTGTVSITAVDIHYEIDAGGSKTEFSK